MTNKTAQTILTYVKKLNAADFQKAWKDFLSHAHEYSPFDRETITSIFRAVSKQKSSANPVRYGKGAYVHQRLESPANFDPRSLRTIGTSPTTKLIVGCPAGHYSSSKCNVGTRAQAKLTLKNCPHNCKHCANYCPKAKTMQEACKVSGLAIADYGYETYSFWVTAPTTINSCSYWAEPMRNPLTQTEQARLLGIAMEHKHDAREHASPIAQAFDLGEAAGLEDAVMLTAGEQGKKLTVNPKEMTPDEEIAEILKMRPGQIWQTYSFQGKQIDIKRLDATRYEVIVGNKGAVIVLRNRLEAVLRGGRPAAFKPYYKTPQEFMHFISSTLVPDLAEAGMQATAVDLEKIDSALRGDIVLGKNEVAYFRDLAKDLKAAGYEQTAHDILEGLYWYALSDTGHKAEIQHKNPVQAPVKGAKLIGTDCLAVEYLDVPKARREGIANPTKPWRHDFEVPGSKIWGLPDGSVLIRGPKPLWRSQPNSVTGK